MFSWLTYKDSLNKLFKRIIVMYNNACDLFQWVKKDVKNLNLDKKSTVLFT